MMNSRFRWMIAAATIAILVLPASAIALERTSVRAADLDTPDEWRSGSSCAVSYFNICTGWIWTWSGWSPQDILGVTFQSCCENGDELASVGIYVWTGAPAGYGFTSTVAAYDADANLCPTGAPLWSLAWLPASNPQGGPVVFPVNTAIVDSTVAVAITTGPGVGNPYSVVTDHPAAGPTGPQACGFCYPSTRVNRSFYWGTASTALCPGSAMHDGVCNSEFWWTAVFSCVSTSVEDTSWGQVKSLYR